MSNEPPNQTLGQTPTDWAILHLAHAAISSESRALWTQIVLQYDEPIRRSLQRLVYDEELAEELNQEFWVRFLRGDFAHATPTRGRFRNLLKTVLIHLVVDHYRQVRREGNRGAGRTDEGLVLVAQIDRQHTADWRQEIIAGALAALNGEVGKSKQICPEVLAVEIEHPDWSSGEKARDLTGRIGREVSPENYRQILHRTHARFADLLVEEVRRSLTDPTPDAVREELAELNLLQYCDVDPAA